MSESSSTIDAAIVAIIARELIEGALFCVDYYGVVLKSEQFTRHQKMTYVKYLTAAVFIGLVMGVAIALGIGFGVAAAVSDEEDVELGIEIGEAVSRMIAAWFVVRLTLKIPTWFGISNYVDPDSVSKGRRISAPLSFAISLWWNVWREATEGGSLTALVTIFDDAMDALALSVGIGVAVGVGFGGAMALGAKYVSAMVFGIIAAVVAQLLAVGLVTGSARAWEEVYEITTGNEGSAIVYKMEDEAAAATLQAFEFVGISDSFTAVTLSVWIVTMVLLTAAQIWHHVYGRELLPRPIKLFIRRIKATVKRPFQRCCGEEFEEAALPDEKPVGNSSFEDETFTDVEKAPLDDDDELAEFETPAVPEGDELETPVGAPTPVDSTEFQYPVYY